MTKPSLHSKVVSRDGARRRRLLVPILVAALMLPLTAAPASPDDRPYEIGVDAYVYAYPMVLMEITRRAFTNVEAPIGSFAPMNQLVHVRQFPDPTKREVVRPNADTLYSLVWWDVSSEPVVASLPETG